MGKIKYSNVITAIACTISISMASFYSGAAAASGNAVSYQSQGKIVFNNNTEDTADDVVFDASDFNTINDMVVSGKKLVGTELNKYPSVNMDLARTIPNFSDLAAAIDTLTDDATADSGMMLNNATAYVKGAKIKGTIPSKGEASYIPGRADQTIAAGQYLSGVQTIKGDSKLTAANIAEGITIFGVTGTAAVESHIIEKNKSASISDISGTITPSSGNNAMEQVTYSISGIDADKIVSGESILGVAGTTDAERHAAFGAEDIIESDQTAQKVLEAGKTYKIPSQKYAENDIYVRTENSSLKTYTCTYTFSNIGKVTGTHPNGTTKTGVYPIKMNIDFGFCPTYVFMVARGSSNTAIISNRDLNPSIPGSNILQGNRDSSVSDNYFKLCDDFYLNETGLYVPTHSTESGMAGTYFVVAIP